MKNEALAAHVGVSAPETPKYLLLNNFLADFFEPRNHQKDKYTFEAFQQDGILVCQEMNTETKEDLKRSFEEFLQCFMGREQLSKVKSANDKIYMPLSLDMLGSANVNLRHLLYHLVFYDEKHSDEERMREKLFCYLYDDSTGIYDIVSQFCGAEVQRHDKKKGTSGFENLKGEKFFKRLGIRFREDLDTLITHPYFKGQDFYKRLEDLAVLLTLYVVLFFTSRVIQEQPSFLCKGSTDSNLNDGGLHRACISNYQSFRDSFSNLLQVFYKDRIEAQLKKEHGNGDTESGGDSVEKQLEENDKFIWVSNQNGTIYIGEKMLKEYVNQVFDANYRIDAKLNEKARDVFSLKDGEKKKLSSEDLSKDYLQLTGKISGTNQQRILSVLQSSGKEIGFVYPISRSRFKYFAMSDELTAFLVRLYLARKDRDYVFSDDFFQELEKRYGIYIRKGKETDTLIRKYRVRATQQEFSRNEHAFLETLERVNCLVRLSDSGYVVTLPEKKGEFKLL